jgi:hypothetical protein
MLLTLFILVLVLDSVARAQLPFYQETGEGVKENDQATQNVNNYVQSNKDFWETMYQNSMLNKKTRYDILSSGSVCFTCPIDRAMFQNLYNEARAQSNQSGSIAPPRISIGWSSEVNNRFIFFCKNNSKDFAKVPLLPDGEYGSGGEIEYVCEDNKLCLLNVKPNYPQKYKCYAKSHVVNVNMNVVGRL